MTRRERWSALFWQKRSIRRYKAMRCPNCSGKVWNIPEAPGSLCGRACGRCDTVWSYDINCTEGKLIIQKGITLVRR